MKKIIPFILFIFSCSGKKHVDKNIEIDIVYAHDSKIDLNKEIYTVYNMKSVSETKFNLTNDERYKITNEYYLLDLDQLPQKMDFEDKCLVMPKFLTVIHTKSLNKTQEITIDSGCDDFYFFDSFKAKRVKKFISLVGEIIFSKPEIKNLPKSDHVYE